MGILTLLFLIWLGVYYFCYRETPEEREKRLKEEEKKRRMQQILEGTDPDILRRNGIEVDKSRIYLNDKTAFKRLVKNKFNHILFERTLGFVGESQCPVVLCVNVKLGWIVCSFFDGSIQVHKLIKNERTKYACVKRKLDDVHNFIEIDEGGNILVGVDAKTNCFRVYKIIREDNNLKDFELYFEGGSQLCDQTVKFFSLYKQSFIITGGKNEETDIKIWNLKGEMLQTISVEYIFNKDFSHSLSGRFLAVGCWPCAVKLYELIIKKDDKFEIAEEVFEIDTDVGTSCLCINYKEDKIYVIDNNNMLTVYSYLARNKINKSYKVVCRLNLAVYRYREYSKIVLSGDSKFLILVSSANILILKEKDLSFAEEIKNAHFCEITQIRTVYSTPYFATYSNDRLVQLWNLSKIC